MEGLVTWVKLKIKKKRDKLKLSSGLAGTLRIESSIDLINYTTATGLAKRTECKNYVASRLAR